MPTRTVGSSLYPNRLLEERPVETVSRPSRELETPTLVELAAWLEEQKARGASQREQFRQLEREWQARLLALDVEARHAAAHLLKRHLKIKKGEEQQLLQELLARLSGDDSPPSQS